MNLISGNVFFLFIKKFLDQGPETNKEEHVGSIVVVSTVTSAPRLGDKVFDDDDDDDIYFINPQGLFASVLKPDVK